MSNDLEKLNLITGPMAVGSSVTTVASFATALVTALSGQWVIARACLAATVLSFGLLANAVYLGTRLSYPGRRGGQQ